MKVAVTGAHGLVGSHCVTHLESKGHEVLRLVHTRKAADDVVFGLGDDLEPSLLAGVDALVHAAYAFGLDAKGVQRVNVEGSQKLLRTARAAGVPRLLFISTVSAFDGCLSVYGQGKLRVEQTVRELGGAVLRPGLIYGERGKGLFGTLAGLTRRLPLLPVFDSGSQPMRLVHIDDLAEAIERALSSDAAALVSPVIVAHPRIVTFRSILETIADRQGRSVGFVSLPGSAVAGALGLVERTGLRLPFGKDNLVGLLNPDPHLAAMSPLVTGCRDFFEVNASEMGV